MAVQVFGPDQKSMYERIETRARRICRMNDYQLTAPTGERWERLKADLNDQERMIWVFNHLKLRTEAAFDKDEFLMILGEMYDHLWKNEDNNVRDEFKEKEYVILETFAFTFTVAKDTLDRKIEKWNKKMNAARKRKDPKARAEREEEVFGMIKDFVQGKMKRKPKVVVSGADFESYFSLFYKYILRKMGNAEERRAALNAVLPIEEE